MADKEQLTAKTDGEAWGRRQIEDRAVWGTACCQEAEAKKLQDKSGPKRPNLWCSGGLRKAVYIFAYWP